MAISGCDVEAVQNYVEVASALSNPGVNDGKKLYLAAYNSPKDIGVSGSEELVNLLIGYIDKWVDGVVARKLRVSTAVHSPFIDVCEETYRTELATILGVHTGPCMPTIPTMSTVTADFKSDDYNIDYLWGNLRQPVLFSDAVLKIIGQFGETTTFLEISPHPVLSQVFIFLPRLSSCH